MKGVSYRSLKNYSVCLKRANCYTKFRIQANQAPERGRNFALLNLVIPRSWIYRNLNIGVTLDSTARFLALYLQSRYKLLYYTFTPVYGFDIRFDSII